MLVCHFPQPRSWAIITGMSKRKDLSGKRFGRLTAISWKEFRGKESFWNCRCDCGNDHVVALGNLQRGSVSSCGCLAVELTIKRSTTHGLSSSKTYVSWRRMLARCYDKKRPGYPMHGGRGIKVCRRWRKFENFLADMGEIPQGLTLDRIDNNGNYEPSNCRWATGKQQARNRRSSVFIEFNGQTKTLVEWSEHFGVPYTRVKNHRKAGSLGRYFSRLASLADTKAA